MAKNRIPTTQAIRALEKGGVDFSMHSYEYKEEGGTSRASQALNVDEGLVIKTLVMERKKGDPFFILMHGDRNVSTKTLARVLGAKKIRPCDPQEAERHTGYFVGGISPFGSKKSLEVFVEESIMDLSEIYINAGKRGLLAKISPKDMARILDPTPVKAAV